MLYKCRRTSWDLAGCSRPEIVKGRRGGICNIIYYNIEYYRISYHMILYYSTLYIYIYIYDNIL